MGLREVVETAVLPPVGGSTSRSRVCLPAGSTVKVVAVAPSWNKVLSGSSSHRWCPDAFNFIRAYMHGVCY